MTETDEPQIGQLNKVTVNLTERAMTALLETADRLGDTKTDTLNRAVQLYAVITALKPGQGARFDRVDGEQVTLQCTDGRRPWWWLALAMLLATGGMLGAATTLAVMP